MQLTQQTDYAIRTLIYTAFHTDRLVNITEIAEFYAISRSHLTKIVAFLSELGYLKSIRGKGGGLKLGKAPESIPLGELIRALESFTLVECFGEKNQCVIRPQCEFKSILAEATRAFLTVLDRYTLADILLPSLPSNTIDLSQLTHLS